MPNAFNTGIVPVYAFPQFPSVNLIKPPYWGSFKLITTTTSTERVPQNVFQMGIAVHGGGGGSWTTNSGAGGGFAFGILDVLPGMLLPTITCGVAGDDTTNGGTSSVGNLISATGGVSNTANGAGGTGSVSGALRNTMTATGGNSLSSPNSSYGHGGSSAGSFYGNGTQPQRYDNAGGMGLAVKFGNNPYANNGGLSAGVFWDSTTCNNYSGGGTAGYATPNSTSAPGGPGLGGPGGAGAAKPGTSNAFQWGQNGSEGSNVPVFIKYINLALDGGGGGSANEASQTTGGGSGGPGGGGGSGWMGGAGGFGGGGGAGTQTAGVGGAGGFGAGGGGGYAGSNVKAGSGGLGGGGAGWNASSNNSSKNFGGAGVVILYWTEGY